MGNIINSLLNPYIGFYTPMGDAGVVLLSTFLICMLYPLASFRDRSNRTLLVICLMLLNVASISNIVLYVCGYNGTNAVSFVFEMLRVIYTVALALAFYIFTVFYWSLTLASKDTMDRNHKFLGLVIHIYILCRFLLGLAIGTVSTFVEVGRVCVLWLAMLYYLILGVNTIIAFYKYDRHCNVTHIYVKNAALTTYVLLWVTVVFLHTTTVATLLYFLPMMVLAYYHHSYSFDVTTGSIDYKGFEHYLTKHMIYNHDDGYCGTIVNFISNNSVAEDVSRFFNDTRLHNATLFSYLEMNQYIFLYKESDEKDVKECLQNKFDALSVNYVAYAFPKLSDREKIISVVTGVFSTYKYTGASRWIDLTDKELDSFVRFAAIRRELLDICDKQDLNDERILVYCQPIYNTHTETFDTAEALMRMELPELGFIFPNEFIPIAEEFHLIHSLTLVILNKVAAFVEKCNNEGYDIKRISVNFSMDEFRNKNICDEIYDIIGHYNIQNNQIALELTESVDDMDVKTLACYLNDIKSHNILLYLDDFGTGYSNFSRIYELPFDVIKFDMHLLMNKEDGKSASINSVIPSFKESGFKLVHEGVETEQDELSCIGLGFDYLQGYKYSKPIPIEKLCSFLKKKN